MWKYDRVDSAGVKLVHLLYSDPGVLYFSSDLLRDSTVFSFHAIGPYKLPQNYAFFLKHQNPTETQRTVKHQPAFSELKGSELMHDMYVALQLYTILHKSRFKLYYCLSVQLSKVLQPDL